MMIIIITILMNVCGTAISTPRLQRPEFAYFLPPSPLCLFFPLRSCRAAAQSFFFFTTRETASASMHPILICRGWGASGILWWLIETPDALNGSRGASAMESSAAYRSIAQRCAVAAAAAAAAARGSSWSSFRDDGDDDDDTQSPPPGSELRIASGSQCAAPIGRHPARWPLLVSPSPLRRRRGRHASFCFPCMTITSSDHCCCCCVHRSMAMVVDKDPDVHCVRRLQNCLSVFSPARSRPSGMHRWTWLFSECDVSRLA